VIQKIRIALVIFVPLFAVSLVFAVAAARNFGQLYPGDVQRIFGMRSTAPAFPELAGVQAPVSFTLAPDAPPAPQVGKVEGGAVVGRASRDKAGFLRFGPWVGLKEGAYLATFSLAANGAGPNEPVAIIEVTGAGAIGGASKVLRVASKVLTSRQLRPSGGGFNDIELTFATPGGRWIETRVYYRGKGTVRAGPISVQPIAVPQAVAHYRDWPLVFLWVGGTALVAWLFAQVMMLRRRSPPTQADDA
jgi:hypothetical protein